MASKKIENKAAFIYSPELMQYKFSDVHPFNPIRGKMTYELLQSIEALQDNQVYPPDLAYEEDLLMAHSPDYIRFIQSLNKGHTVDQERLNNYGFATEDTPIFDNMHRAGLILVGATLSAVKLVLTHQCKHALNLSGGLHHALYGKASGFCIYNDIVIAIKYILTHYNLKVLYVDTDAHHGDGVQWAFYDEPQVCTLSLHETGRYLFPGTGGITERGSGKGFGYTFNIPLDAYTDDESWLWCYTQALEKVMEFFKPDIIITQNGADGHYYDPLSHLHLTMKTYERIPKLAHELSHKFCDGKWIALGGGGYDIFRVVPRAWAYIWLEMNGYDKKLKNISPQWIEKWQKYSHNTIPVCWQDPVELVKPVPRKEDITYKNKSTLRNALYTISGEQIGNKFLQRP
ncbi:MAG: acetoin utilization protein AcuC [Eubacteriales bacterium]